jgi:saxitoxin biosynthesis operon SxtJ-like protein
MSITSTPKLPSERRFGFTFAAALAGLAVYRLIHHRSRTVFLVCIVTSIIFALLAFLVPRILAPLNKLWFLLGEAMGKVVSPVVLGVIFYGILTPISVVTRLFGRDELRLKRGALNSYWIDCTSSHSAAESFKNQF